MKTKFLNIFRNIFKLPVLEKWLRRKTQNKPVNSFWCKLVPNNYQYPKNSYRIFKTGNITLKADIQDYVGHYLYFGFKDNGQEKLQSLVTKGDVILDIGTNIGATLLHFAANTGASGKVFGFEPDPFNFSECLNNIKLNHFNNIQVENIGLGNEKGEFKLYVDTETNRSGNRILKTDIINKNFSIIQVDTLDNWVSKQNISKIDLIKIDVEGFETNVIKGGWQTLKKFKPVLFIELDDNNLKDQNSSAKEVITLLSDLGYHCKNAQTNENVTLSDNFTNCHFDIICTTKLKS